MPTARGVVYPSIQRGLRDSRLLLNGIHYAHLFMQPTVNCDEAWQALAQKTIDTSSTEPETKGNNNHQDGKPETVRVRGTGVRLVV